MSRRKVDRAFLIVSIILVLAGTLIFISASLGLLAEENTNFSRIITKQLIFTAIGLIGLFAMSKVHYKHLKKYALPIFILSLVVTALVFVPFLGFKSGGATRWLSIGGLSFQPAEFLKIGFVIYFAAWLANTRDRIKSLNQGLIPMGVIFSVISIMLLLQPNTGMLVVIISTGLAMFLIAGGKWKHFLLLILIASMGLTGLMLYKPYIKDRIVTYLDYSSVDPQAEGYQITQSLLAIGSGGVTGRGFGQSIQKFNYLPEAVGDSIFAVLGEEFGFIGGIFIIILFLLFAVIGLKIAARAPDIFSRLLVSGIVILISIQSFLNIGAMLAVFPLSGIPLLFISQGGSALVFTLVGVGIVLNVSKYQLK